MYGVKRKTGAYFIYFIIITVFLVIDTVALADDEVPESCQGTYEKISYNAGKTTGENIVTMAWNKINDCDKIELFESVIDNIVARLTLPDYASQTVACRYAGYINGVMNKINSIYTYCEVQCYYDGEILGDFAAKAYCDLSIALHGLSVDDDFIRAPVQLCGFNFEFACDVTFMYTTFTYSNPLGSCEPYTYDSLSGPFFDVWDQTRNNQCAYDIVLPLDPPGMKIR